MSSIQHLLKFPPHIIVKKVINRFTREWNYKKHRKRLTETDNRHFHSSHIFARLIDIPKTDHLPRGLDIICRHYKNHRFDLLGSGWVKNNYDTVAPGLEDYHYNNNLDIATFDVQGDWLSHVVLDSHLKISKECWSRIVELNPDYLPIDWQKDFKSGFRYSAKHWFREQRKLMGDNLGVDLKVPWELSRLQHLPQMAIFAQYEDLTERKKTVTEFMCQTLDFIMANPIGMGVNFNCPMDIGIRNANVLLALDFFMAIDDSDVITRDFINTVLQFVAESTHHILEDIEYREGLTSNHYLGNVLGILFAGAYIESHKDADRWLAFGIQELQRSMDRQFFDDGANFEGSTSYHRLSGEMMVWGAMLAWKAYEDRKGRLSQYPTHKWPFEAPLYTPANQQFLKEDFVFTATFWKRLVRSGLFAESITKPNGEIPQFGDNDSGRFIKLQPIGGIIYNPVDRYLNLTVTYKEMYGDDQYWDENSLNLAGFISSVLGMLNQKPKRVVSLADIEFEVFSSFANKAGRLSNYLSHLEIETTTKHWSTISDKKALGHHKTKSFAVEHLNLQRDLKAEYFPDFQFIVFSGAHVNLFMSGISNPNQHHSFGHVHNDKLSVEIHLDGEDIVFDPGTYLYTPIPDRRIMFRSVTSHNTISVDGQEQNTPLPGRMGLFNMKAECTFHLIELGENFVEAEIHYRDVIHRRKVSILDHEILIEDWCNHSFTQHFNDQGLYSNGYGKRIA